MPSKQHFTPGPNALGQCLASPAPKAAVAQSSNAARAGQLSSMPARASSPMCEVPSLWGSAMMQATEAKGASRRRPATAASHHPQEQATEAKGASRRRPAAAASHHLQKRDEGTATNLSAASLATGAKFDVASAAVQKSGMMGSAMESMQEGLGHAGRVAGTTLGFMGHLLGDDQIAESDSGHVASSMLNMGADVASHVGLGRYLDVHDKMRSISEVSSKSPMSAAGRTIASSPVVAAVAALDDMVAVDNPAKLATAMTAELHPGTQLGKAIGGGVDAITAAGQYMSGSEAAGMRSAEAVEDKSVNGEYGAIAQAATLGAGMLLGDEQVKDKTVDQKAKTGERGVLLAWGNAAADGMSEENKGGRYSDYERTLQESRDRSLFKPWTW